MNRPMFNLIAIVMTLSWGCIAQAEDSAATTSTAPRYTFSWPLDTHALQPRGGTTRGTPITLDTSPSREWVALRDQSLSSFERDRRAILAMAGTYRVSFDFLEITSFAANPQRAAPYQSWGTEKIYVDRDDGKRISLVHILEMRSVQPDGSISAPRVVKHWRQDWQYEPSHIVEYRGRERWQRRTLERGDSRGVWLQTVYQVDESPRYASLGVWQHTASFSIWLSGETWRPLPRREWSVREDYHVLIGTNRHTVYASGWVQEENNLKTVLTAERAIQTHLAREYGVARYERIKNNDFAAADAYFAATRSFWNRVRDTWATAFVTHGTITLRGPVDKLGLFRPLFAHADALEAGTVTMTDSQAVILATLRDMGAMR